MRSCHVIGAVVVAAAAASTAAGQNGPFGQPVSLAAGTASGAALGTIVDGAFLPEGTQWQTGTVWWQGTATVLQIDFIDGPWFLETLTLQADNNDTYRVEYRDLFSANWFTWQDVGPSGGAGMRTRTPSVTTVATDGLRISAISGDNSYSVSEIQALGFLVPAPGALVAAGLGMVLASRRRRAT